MNEEENVTSVDWTADASHGIWAVPIDMVHGTVVPAQNFEMGDVAVDDKLSRGVNSQLGIVHPSAEEGAHTETVMNACRVCSTAAEGIHVASRVVVADQEAAAGAVLSGGDGGDGSVAKIAGGRLPHSFWAANVEARTDCCFEGLAMATAVYRGDLAEGLRRRMGATLDG